MNAGAENRLSVLVVDDEAQTLQACRVALRTGGIGNVLCCQDGREVMDILARADVGVVLLDLSMPHISGQQLLPMILQEHPGMPVLVVTAANEIETAVGCMRAGASDYMVKPVEKERLLAAVRKALEFRQLRHEYSVLKRHLLSDKLDCPEAFSDIVTNSQAMKSIFQYVESVARTPRAVLITGETGVGKELIARAIHAISGRPGRFVTVNVAGLDDSLFADTLFGHVKGAFTGADSSRDGLVDSAVEGTLFLDEIGDLSLSSQVKLLRLLQEGEYLPLGTVVPRKSDARVLVATHHDLALAESEGRFRKDLYYRLQTHRVHIPPLRERMRDLPLLLDHLLDKAADSLSVKKPTTPPELLDLLSSYHFPGNVRELESMVFDAVSNHRAHVLSMNVFKAHIGDVGARNHVAPCANGDGESLFSSLHRLPTIKDATNELIAEAMKRANGNQTAAARLLGIGQSALNRRLKRSDG